MTSLNKRALIKGTVALGASLAAPTLLRAQSTAIRWGESLAGSHPQVQMAERIAKEVKEKSSGRLDIQVFPNSQLGSGKDMIEAVSAGALQMTTDGAGALGAFLPQLSAFAPPGNAGFQSPRAPPHLASPRRPCPQPHRGAAGRM